MKTMTSILNRMYSWMNVRNKIKLMDCFSKTVRFSFKIFIVLLKAHWGCSNVVNECYNGN